MARKLKVYGWTAHVFATEALREALRLEPWHQQVRAVVAAESQAAVARIVGAQSPRALFNLGETGNATEIAMATAAPGKILLTGMNGGKVNWVTWDLTRDGRLI